MHAAIDLGSNTFRLLIARPRPPGEAGPPWHRVDYAHRIVRLGEGLHQSGRIQDAARERAVAALRDFAHIMQNHGLKPELAHAVATAALREAANGEEVVRTFARETGIRPRIISGDEEARLSLAGACAVLDVQTRQDMLLFDIGGGSTEFIRAEAGQARDAISRPLGVVRLVETHLASDPPSDRDYAAMVNAARAHLEAVSRFWEQHGAAHPPAHLVGTAGTVTTLAATEMNLVPYDADAVNNHVMTRQSIADLRERLCAMTHEARESLPTIEEGRADLIIAGLAIVEAVMDCWNYPAMTVVDAGLLEGVWLQARSDQALRK